MTGQPEPAQRHESLVERVKRERAERLAARGNKLDLPIEVCGWSGDLVARFRVIDLAAWKQTSEDADVLAKACKVLLLRDREQDRLEEIRDEAGHPVGFDTRLGPILGAPDDLKETRDVVRFVFFDDEEKVVNDMAISDMAAVVVRWIRGRTLAAEAALLGGS